MLHRICIYGHTARSDTIFIRIYMDAPPGVPGVPGVSKNHISFFTNKTVQIEPELRKLRKTVKIEKKNHQKFMFSYSFSNTLPAEMFWGSACFMK